MRNYANGRDLLKKRLVKSKTRPVYMLFSSFLSWLVALGLSYLLSVFGLPQPLTFVIIFMIFILIPMVYTAVLYIRYKVYGPVESIGGIILGYAITALVLFGLSALFSFILKADFYLVFTVVTAIDRLVNSGKYAMSKDPIEDTDDYSAEEAFFLLTGRELSELDKNRF